MDITGRVLREVEFRDRLRGYDTDEVDEFLEKVAVAVDAAEAELTDLRRRADAAEARADAAVAAAAAAATQAASAPAPRDDVPHLDDDGIRRTLILAQRTADLAIAEAREEAERLVSGARAEADSLLNEAEKRANRLATEADREFHDRMGRLAAQHESLVEEINVLEQTFVIERSRLAEALSSALEFVTGTFQLSDDVVSRVRTSEVPVPTSSREAKSDAAAELDDAQEDEEAPAHSDEASDFVVDLGGAGPVGEFESDEAVLGHGEPETPDEPGERAPHAAGPIEVPRALLDLPDDDIDLDDIERELSEDAAAAHVPPWESRRATPSPVPRRSGVMTGDDPDEELWAKWAAGPDTSADPERGTGAAVRGDQESPGAGIFKIDRRRGGT